VTEREARTSERRGVRAWRRARLDALCVVCGETRHADGRGVGDAGDSVRRNRRRACSVDTSDCLNVINNIKEMLRCAYMMILREIYEISKSFDCVRFTHEGREFNREAHYLAKYACLLGPGRHVWLAWFPSCIP